MENGPACCSIGLPDHIHISYLISLELNVILRGVKDESNVPYCFIV